MNLITIELCAEDRARIDRLIAALDRGCSSCAESFAECLSGAYAAKANQGAAPVPPAVEAEPVTAPAPAADQAPWEDPAPEVSLAEFQKALTLRCSESAETKAKVRALLNQYAAAASAVPPEKRAEILAKLQQI